MRWVHRFMYHWERRGRGWGKDHPDRAAAWVAFWLPVTVTGIVGAAIIAWSVR